MPETAPSPGCPEIVAKLIDLGQSLSTAESCTGGLIAHSVTDVAGSSACFLGGIVAYSNEAKMRFANVAKATLIAHGAVSEAVARELAMGAKSAFESSWAVGVTGIAGPGGGTKEKPVGLVYIGIAGDDVLEVVRHEFSGSRQAIKQSTANAALAMLWSHLS
jgi:nicotinamide-nucleotide amidase